MRLGKTQGDEIEVLSVQMPVQAADARSEAYYPALFPEAIDRIARAAAWLEARGEGSSSSKS